MVEIPSKYSSLPIDALFRQAHVFFRVTVTFAAGDRKDSSDGRHKILMFSVTI